MLTKQGRRVILIHAERDKLDSVTSGTAAFFSRLAERAAQEGRADDNETTVRKRLEVFKEQTAPVVDYYEKRDKLRSVNGLGPIEEVAARISEAVT